MFMKDEVKEFLIKFGVFKVGVANPRHGFEMAKEGCHPRDVMKNCSSVIVFACHTGLDYYATLDCGQKDDVESRVFNIYCDWVSSRLANFLEDKGYDVVVPHGFKDEKDKISRLSFKLAAYEAGLGVYGRPSILITPEYGPRVNLRVVLTDASIPPDKPLKNFEPCQHCDTCVKLCPINAISKELPPPKGFDRNRCIQFIDQIREKTGKKIRYCGYCYNHCVIGEISKKVFNLSKWRTLLDLSEHQRKELLQTLNADKR